MKILADGTGMLALAVLPLFLGFSNLVDNPAADLFAPMSDANNTLDGYRDGPLAAGPFDYYADDRSQAELTFYVRTYRASGGIEEQIQLFLQVTDGTSDVLNTDLTPNRADTLRLSFDVDHDHQLTAVDRTILILRKATGNICDACVQKGNWDLTGLTNLDHAQWRIDNSSGGSWSAEIQIRAADLGLNIVPRLLGMGIRVRNTANVVGLDYPSSPVASWANLRTRKPIDFTLSLDMSGSMLALDGVGESRWERAKRATDLFVAALGVFHDSHFDDKVAVSQYSWTCGSPPPTAAQDYAGEVPGLLSFLTFQPIPSVPTDPAPSFTSNNTVAPAASNCTPIEGGLVYAVKKQGALSTDRDRIVVLLSDGMHNTPSSTFDFGAFNTDEKDRVQVQTVAIGPDGIVNNMLLDDIATAFRGNATAGARFNNTQSFADLMRAYVETIEDPLAINTIDLSGGGQYNPGPADKLAFVGVWNDKTLAQSLSLTQGGTARIPTASFVSTKTGYAIAVFDPPPQGGGWVMTGPSSTQGQRYVLADLRILARFLVEQRQYAAGEPMVLTVSLTDRGRGIVGAEVTVEAEGPGQGLGNYLSTIQQDCSFAKPSIPDSVPQIDATGATAAPTHALVSRSAPDTARAMRDPLPGRYRLAADAFARCKVAGLQRDSLPGQRLYDDATHGDLIAGDGEYAGTFSATQLEGTRNFVFHARGRTTDGIDFTRTRRLSRYVRIHPDSRATQEVVRLGPVTNGQQLAHIFFLPLDRLANFLGPGFGQSFQVRSIGAQLVGPVTDLENGYYVQTIRYPAGGPEPRVTIDLPGTRFEKVVDFHPTPEIWKWLLRWLCPILIVLLLILLLLQWKRRQGQAMQPHA